MTHNVYEGDWTLADGEKLTLRHIKPADEAKEQSFVQGLSPESSYRRFHGTKKDLGMKELKEFTHPDARNSVAIVVLVSTDKGEEEIGEARYVIEPDWANSEFAIVIADKWQKRGIGTRLMNALITHLKACGVKQISGSVIKSNTAMRTLMKRMDFEELNDPDDSSTLSVRKKFKFPPRGKMLELSELKKLAEMPTAERAYLSVYLAGPNSVDELKKKFEKIRRLLKTGGTQKDEKEYFDDNVRLVTEYLDRSPLKTGALCIFSCQVFDVFRAIPLSEPVYDLIRIDSSPFIRPLAELIEGHATAAVVVADNKKARIFVVSMAETGSEEVIKGNVKNHVKVGGWSQQRYERRRDNELHKYALEIVDALAKISGSEEIDHILMVGSKETLQSIHENMPQEQRDKVVEKAIDLSKGDSSINKDIMELCYEEELTTGLEHWEKIRREYLRGGLAVIGPEDVLSMAKAQRIEHAVVDRTLQPPGMRCRDCDNLNIGKVLTCLACGSRSLYEVDVFNDILEMVYQSGGTAHFTEPIQTLTDSGGIAAHLRY